MLFHPLRNLVLRRVAVHFLLDLLADLFFHEVDCALGFGSFVCGGVVVAGEEAAVCGWVCRDGPRVRGGGEAVGLVGCVGLGEGGW